jgi:hypothetical protein
VNVEWMARMDVVKHLLRANLHQKQYVDQVRHKIPHKPSPYPDCHATAVHVSLIEF